MSHKSSKRALIWGAVSTRPQADDEKFSIPKQIEDGQAMCDREGWQVVDVLKVPGHSRDYRSLDKLASDARKHGIDAFDRLIEHFDRRDFDIFICRDANRFARKASLLHYIAETIIEDCGALIYSQADNLYVNEENLPWWATIQGYKVRAEVKWLIDARKGGMEKRAERGLPTSAHGHIYSHRVVEVDGKEQTVVNEDARRLFLDVAEFLLEGVSWQQMGERLTERGHRRPDGKAFTPSSLRKWVMHPTFWGNSAQHFQDPEHFSTARGFWVFDPLEPAPDYVTIHYGTHEAMYTGERAVRVQQELRRRYGLNGKSHPQYTGKFTGLVVCRTCGYAFGYKRDSTWTGMRCTTKDPTDCPNTRYINEQKLVRTAGELLTTIVENGDWTAFYPKNTSVDDLATRLAAIERDLVEQHEQYDWLLARGKVARSSVSQSIDTQLSETTDTIEALEAEARRLGQQALDIMPTDAQKQAANEAASMIKDGTYWNQTDKEINQSLYRILGKWRFVVLDSEVRGMSNEPKRYGALSRS